jgi:hypothetical protein
MDTGREKEGPARETEYSSTIGCVEVKTITWGPSSD